MLMPAALSICFLPVVTWYATGGDDPMNSDTRGFCLDVDGGRTARLLWQVFIL